MQLRPFTKWYHSLLGAIFPVLSFYRTVSCGKDCGKTIRQLKFHLIKEQMTVEIVDIKIVFV
jgi:hypothetical protein